MQNKNDSYHLPIFIQAMLKPEFYDYPVDSCQLIETHISWVILTGNFVYKIKKPINLGFVDFSTLEKRKFYCEEELRLNRRLAPKIYLDVIPISGSVEKPVLTGKDKAFEYAVKMQQFSQNMQLDHVLARNELRQHMVDSFANLIAQFHQHVEVANTAYNFGEPEQVYQPAQENFIQIRDHINDKSKIDLLSIIERWTEDTFNGIKNVFKQRKEKGFIRECHGDLHLRNLAWHENKPLAFDCLEFNENFRWIDVVSEIAFLIMDLDVRNQPELAHHFLNKYLELTGDYEGCSVLRFYLVYRVMVRTKVDAIRAVQSGISQQESDEANAEIVNYLQLALTYTHKTKPFIIITHGMSASGKSTITQPLLEKLGAIRVRADVERKRLFNIKPEQISSANIQQGIYTKEATHKTYLKLLDLTESIIDAGFPAIVDATFSTIEQRTLFNKFASQKQVRFVMLNFIASEETLKQRIRNRKNDVSDADITVLENQIKNWQPIEQNEEKYSVSINTEKKLDIEQLISRLKLD